VIEQGIVLLVQSSAEVSALAASGGYMSMLPKDMELPSWTQQTVTEPGDYTLTGSSGLCNRLFQIDVYADDPDQCVDLARAIDRVLDGFRGVLNDADSTVVQGIFRENMTAIFDSASRSYRRILEYRVRYEQG
jgi:hypothetical protein